MSEKLIYTAEPEFKLEGLWLPAPREVAKRWAVYRTIYFPKKRGDRRPKPQRRLLAAFFGPDAELCANKLVARSMSLAKPKPSKPKVLHRSLTKNQWLEAQQEELHDLRQE